MVDLGGRHRSSRFDECNRPPEPISASMTWYRAASDRLHRCRWRHRRAITGRRAIGTPHFDRAFVIFHQQPRRFRSIRHTVGPEICLRDCRNCSSK